ncbi:putative ribonuclease H-like domain-containing protein [Tanacetum coccineum]
MLLLAIFKSLEDESWVDAMQEELLQFKIPKVWILVDLPFRKKAIGIKWVYKKNKDERGVVVRNKVRIEAIKIFLAFASYMEFIVYHMDVKSAFLYGTIDEEVILKKFDFDSVKTVSTPIETQKPLVKDEEATDVDVTPKTSHLNAVKRIFRYLKGKPKLGLWYPRVSTFDLEAYSDSDYARANLDRKWTTGEKKYPLTKETLERMMSLKLIAESASDGAYDLLRFIQKQIDEARSHDGGEKDL